MSTLPAPVSFPTDAVTAKGGRAVTTSLAVSRVFLMLHKNVLQAIDRLDCSAEFRRLNFQPSNYRNEQGKQQPMVEMTRDGMVFLVMGFTGRQAAQFKEAYIAAFNQLEDRLSARTPFLLAEVLAAHPEWGTIRRCLAADLTTAEIARVLRCGETTVRRHRDRMHALGLIAGGVQS